MKKAYNKPKVFVESFVLNQNIAFNCFVPWGGDPTLGKPNHSEKTSCGWDMGNFIAWVDAENKCNLFIPPSEGVGAVCYNTPSGGNTIFGS